MKNIFSVCFAALMIASCNLIPGSPSANLVNRDSLRADSMWKVAMDDSIRHTKTTRHLNKKAKPDTALSEIESVAKGIDESVGQMQDGLKTIKKVTEAGTAGAKVVTNGINKTKEAVKKTVGDAKKTIIEE